MSDPPNEKAQASPKQNKTIAYKPGENAHLLQDSPMVNPTFPFSFCKTLEDFQKAHEIQNKANEIQNKAKANELRLKILDIDLKLAENPPEEQKQIWSKQKTLILETINQFTPPPDSNPKKNEVKLYTLLSFNFFLFFLYFNFLEKLCCKHKVKCLRCFCLNAVFAGLQFRAPDLCSECTPIIQGLQANAVQDAWNLVSDGDQPNKENQEDEKTIFNQ